MKVIAKLRKFKNFSGIKATLTDRQGKAIIDTVTKEGGFNGKFIFNFDREDLPGRRRGKRVNLKITFESLNNADEANFRSRNNKFFSFDPLEQSTRFRLIKRRNRTIKSFLPLGNLIIQKDPDPIKPPTPKDLPPVFSSSNEIDPIVEGTSIGTTIYTALAKDDEGSVTYSLSGSDGEAFKIDPQSGVVTTQTAINHSAKSNYDFNIVATDSKSNQTALALKLAIKPAGTTATKVAGKSLSPGEPLTAFNDTINCTIGSFELAKSAIQDESRTDQDTINIESDSRANLKKALPNALFINIENFIFNPNNDNSGDVDLTTIVNGKSLSFAPDSTFTAFTTFKNWGQTGITDFNFSNIKSKFGVSLASADSGDITNTDNIKITGTHHGDLLQGLAGDTAILGYKGDDLISGPTSGQATLAGGGGLDEINIINTKVQNTINISAQNTTENRDVVIGYVGFNDISKADGSFDLIQIDQTTFPNYIAGATIQQKTVQQAGSEASLLNTIIVDKEANIKKQIFPNATKGLLAFATDTATLHFAPAGNFPANTQDLLTVDSKDFSAPDQILVV